MICHSSSHGGGHQMDIKLSIEFTNQEWAKRVGNFISETRMTLSSNFTLSIDQIRPIQFRQIPLLWQ